MRLYKIRVAVAVIRISCLICVGFGIMTWMQVHNQMPRTKRKLEYFHDAKEKLNPDVSDEAVIQTIDSDLQITTKDRNNIKVNHTDNGRVYNENNLKNDYIDSRNVMDINGETNKKVVNEFDSFGAVNEILPFPTEVQKPGYIFFNRVPKCGSTGTKAIFKILSNVNKWHMKTSTIYDRERINETSQAQFVDEFYQRSPPVVFERHLNFINFTRFGAKMPFYINVVREPFERLVSDYYFLRNHLSKMFKMSTERRARTYDECVQGNYSECLADGPQGYYRIIPFFCGQELFCRVPSWESVNQAKRNVNQHYSLVGIVEELAGFMQVLEHVAPSFFKNAYHIFMTNGDKMKDKYKTRKKIPPQEKTIFIMKEKLGYDYDFYSFIKQKFYLTWKIIKEKYNLQNNNEYIDIPRRDT